jgi:hypothetical protein
MVTSVLKIEARAYKGGSPEKLTLEANKVSFVRANGQLIFEHEPGIRVLGGCSKWGYHVWSTRAYSVLDECEGHIPLVVSARPPSLIKRDEKGWTLLVFGRVNGEWKPWLPISVIVEADISVRKGVLMTIR